MIFNRKRDRMLKGLLVLKMCKQSQITIFSENLNMIKNICCFDKKSQILKQRERKIADEKNSCLKERKKMFFFFHI